jgi:DNA-binding NtrC family response regulator
MTNPVTDRPPVSSQPRVLIVEDEIALAQTMADMAHQLGGAPVICRSGYRARAELAQQPPSVIVLDVGLPDMNALSLLPSCGPAKVLVIAAQGNLQHAIAATRQGAAAYMVKPVDLDQLRETLREWIAASPATPVAVPVAAPKSKAAAAPVGPTKKGRSATVKAAPPRPPSNETEERMRDGLTAWLRDQVATGSTYDQIMNRIEEHVLRELLRQYNNRSTHLASALDINRVTLLKRRKLFKLDP